MGSRSGLGAEATELVPPVGHSRLEGSKDLEISEPALVTGRQLPALSLDRHVEVDRLRLSSLQPTVVRPAGRSGPLGYDFPLLREPATLTVDTLQRTERARRLPRDATVVAQNKSVLLDLRQEARHHTHLAAARSKLQLKEIEPVSHDEYSELKRT